MRPSSRYRVRIFVRYSRSDRDVAQGSFFGPPGNGHPGLAALGEQQQLPAVNTIDPVSLAVGHTLIVSSAIVNELRVGYASNGAYQHNLATSALFEEFGLQGIPPVAGLTGLPLFNITGFGMLAIGRKCPTGHAPGSCKWPTIWRGRVART
jgi:hypothetical protein